MVDQAKQRDTGQPVATSQARLRSAHRRPRRGRRGQNMVELALTAPLLALLLIGAADLGRAFIYHTRLTNAIEAGALAGRFAPSSDNAPITTDSACYDANYIGYIDCRVVVESKGMVSRANVVVECFDASDSAMTTPLDCSNTANGVGVGDLLVVRATYQFRPLTSQLVGILGNGYTMSKTVRMVITG